MCKRFFSQKITKALAIKLVFILIFSLSFGAITLLATFSEPNDVITNHELTGGFEPPYSWTTFPLSFDSTNYIPGVGFAPPYSWNTLPSSFDFDSIDPSEFIIPDEYESDSSCYKLIVLAFDPSTQTTTAYCMITNEPLTDFDTSAFTVFDIHEIRSREIAPFHEDSHIMFLFRKYDLKVYLGARDADELILALYQAYLNDFLDISENYRELAKEIFEDLTSHARFGFEPHFEFSTEQRRVVDTQRTPYAAVGLVEVQFSQGDTWFAWGTGFMISRNHLLTAGHVIFENNVWIRNARFSPGATYTHLFNPSIPVTGIVRPYGTHYVNSWVVGGPWSQSGGNHNIAMDADWGAMRLSTTPPIPNHLPLRVATDAHLSGISVSTIGYPRMVQFSPNTMI